MSGSDEPHPYPKSNSPTRLSTSRHASYKGRSCIKVATNVLAWDGGKSDHWTWTTMTEDQPTISDTSRLQLPNCQRLCSV